MQQVPRKRPGTSVGKQTKKNSYTTKKRKKVEKDDKVEKDLEEVNTGNDSGYPSCSTSFNDSTITCKLKESPESSSINLKFEEDEIKCKNIPVNNIESLNIAQLLALGENSGMTDFARNAEKCESDNSDSEMSDLEEVQEVSSNEPQIPKEGVNIILEAPTLYQKNKRKGIDVEAHLKRQINRVKKDIQILIHKVHLLCWIGHLKFVNNILNDPSLMKICATMVKSKNLYPSKHADISYLEGILKWFHKNFVIKQDNPELSGGLLKELKYQLEMKQGYSFKNIIFMFIVLLRFLGLKVRIIMSFQVVPVKPPSTDLFEKKDNDSGISKNVTEKPNDDSGNEKKTKHNNKGSNTLKMQNSKNYTEKHSSDIKSGQDCQSKIIPVKKKTVPDLSENKSVQNKKRKIKKCDDNYNSNDSDNSETYIPNPNKKKLKQMNKNKNPHNSEAKGSDDDIESRHFRKSVCEKSNTRSKSNPQCDNKKRILKKPQKKISKKSEEIASEFDNSSCESDSGGDFTPQSLKKKAKKTKEDRKCVDEMKKCKSVRKKEYFDVWAEVYLEAEEKWISVDVIRKKIHCVNELYSRATHPVVYVIACNNDSTLKDVTKRYVPNWHSDTRKKRVDEGWWNSTMLPYIPPKNVQDKEEDEDINRQLSDKPLPCVISEYKDHPLYVLKRHLLKFEGIYPPDAPTLGFIRGEPVYARECVVTLRSREVWYKEARVVRLKEEPYKIVKARPKFDKMTGEIKKDLPLELFGVWQTEEYIPPIATDGKVPRNEYGNVDLFKPCMLPIGTVHLEIPALNRVAKKLGIDCAPATVGFEYHSGGSHPVFNGFVVCEEFKEILLDAWNKEIDESAKKNEEKKEKRVYGNWKRLIRGLLIREKLKIKYSFGEHSDEETSNVS